MPDCPPHHWKIPSPPERPVGVCARCGASKTFSNVAETAPLFEYPVTFGDSNRDHAPVNDVPYHLWSKDGRL